MQTWWRQANLRDGLILRRALVPTMTTSNVVRNAVRQKIIVALQRGVYLPDRRAASALEAARAALVAVSEPDSAASHVTAALVHGLRVPGHLHDREHITIPRPERRPHRPRLQLHTARLPEDDVVVLEGVPVTTVARTLVDLCRSWPRLDAVCAVEDALRRELVVRDDLDLSSWRLTRTPWIIRARSRFNAADPRSQSPLETQARLVLMDAKLPTPESQLVVELPTGGRAYLDLGYRRQQVGIELDGRDVHAMPRALYNDRVRQNALTSLGWTILRFTWTDVTRGRDSFVATVAAALRR
jgi:hypothetical protein